MTRLGQVKGGMFNFLRNQQTLFYSGCASLHFHQEYMRIPVASHICQHLARSVFLILSILKGWGLPCSSIGKESACSVGNLGLIPQSGRSSGERNGKPIPVFLPGKSHGQKSLVGCSPWDRKESGPTGQLALTYLLTYLKR